LLCILITTFGETSVTAGDGTLDVTTNLVTANPLNSTVLLEDDGLDVKQCELIDSKDVQTEDAVESLSFYSFLGTDRINTLRMWSMLLVNVMIVGSVNGVYIYSTLQSYSVVSGILIQYTGALILVLILNQFLIYIICFIGHI
jgi:hypothetical protein